MTTAMTQEMFRKLIMDFCLPLLRLTRGRGEAHEILRQWEQVWVGLTNLPLFGSVV